MQQASPSIALVTGGSGLIGGHLARRLIEQGWQVKLLLRNPSKIAEDLRRAEIIEGDLSNIEALNRAVADVSVVFHCAAKVDSWGKREDYWAANVTGTKNLLQAIAQNNSGITRLIHISTVDVYGFPKDPCDESAAVVETGFAYGDSKREGEIYVRDFCAKYNIPYTIIRPCNVIGPNSQFIDRIGQQLKDGLMLVIDKGRINAGILYIDTLIDYMVWAAKDPKAIGQIYNIREPYDISWADFIRHLQTSLGTRAMIINLPFRLADIFARLCALFYRVFMPAKEPLLHPLIIRIFGRTCGHSAEKIHATQTLKTLEFDEAMLRSVKWYKEKF